MKFKIDQTIFVGGVSGTITSAFVGEDGDLIYDVLLANDALPTEFLEREIRGSVTPRKRLSKTLKSLGSPPRLLRGAYLGQTHEGGARYVVNQAALDCEEKPHVERVLKQRAFVRVSLKTASKEQVQNALHKVVMKRRA